MNNMDEDEKDIAREIATKMILNVHLDIIRKLKFG